jgi:hypothetical protein
LEAGAEEGYHYESNQEVNWGEERLTQRITEPIFIFRQQVFTCITAQHLPPEPTRLAAPPVCIPAAAPALGTATIRAVVGRLV